MNIKASIKRTILRASVYFTLITAIYTLLVMLVNVEEDTVLLSASQVLLNFVFALLASMAWEVFCIQALSTVLRVICHFLILLFSFYTCFLLPMNMRGSQIFVGVIAFTAVYLLLMGIGAGIRAKFRANTEKTKEYVNRFDVKK